MRQHSKLLLAAPLAGAVALLSLTIPPAVAHKGATGVVKQRMDVMKSFGDAMKAIKKMLDGEMTYDAAKVRKAAGVIKAHGGEALTKLFPKGSLQKPTEAKPEIWQNWTEFEADATRLKDYAEALEVVAARKSEEAEASGMIATMKGSDITEGGWPSAAELKQMPPQAVFMALGKTCKSCHESFRQKKDEHDHEGHAHDEHGDGDHDHEEHARDEHAH